MAVATGGDPQSAIPERTANRSPTACQRRPATASTKPQPTEPFLIPKLRNYFADFPCPPFATKSETIYLGFLMRKSVRTRAMITRSTNFSRANEKTPDGTKVAPLFKRAYPLLATTAFDGQQPRAHRGARAANLF